MQNLYNMNIQQICECKFERESKFKGPRSKHPEVMLGFKINIKTSVL